MSDLLSRHLVPSDDALDSQVGNETVLLHLGNDTYYGLDAIGTRIWTLLKERQLVPEIRDRIAAEYAVDPTQVESDLRPFLEDLLRHGILVDA